MIGEAHALAVEVPLPIGVELPRATAEANVHAMCAIPAAVFATPTPINQSMLCCADWLSTTAWSRALPRLSDTLSAGRVEPVRDPCSTARF